MYGMEPRVTVRIKFKAMEEPVEVSVPWNMLPYLDLCSDRWISADGEVVYERPRMKLCRKELRRVPAAA